MFNNYHLTLSLKSSKEQLEMDTPLQSMNAFIFLFFPQYRFLKLRKELFFLGFLCFVINEISVDASLDCPDDAGEAARKSTLNQTLYGLNFSSAPAFAYSNVSCLAFYSDLGLKVLLRSLATLFPDGASWFLSSYLKQASIHFSLSGIAIPQHPQTCQSAVVQPLVPTCHFPSSDDQLLAMLLPATNLVQFLTEQHKIKKRIDKEFE
ncbi:hypothetical protein ABZP36_030618 [Zizania latifolia]